MYDTFPVLIANKAYLCLLCLRHNMPLVLTGFSQHLWNNISMRKFPGQVAKLIAWIIPLKKPYLSVGEDFFLLFVEPLTFQQNNRAFQIPLSTYTARYVNRHLFHNSNSSSLKKRYLCIQNDITRRQIYVSGIHAYNYSRHHVSSAAHLPF